MMTLPGRATAKTYHRRRCGATAPAAAVWQTEPPQNFALAVCSKTRNSACAGDA
jgi:hypothetical protein